MTVQTIDGAKPADALGVTLMHEHLLVNLMREFRGTGLLNDPEEAADELAHFEALGGGTVIDATPTELTTGASADPGDWRGRHDPQPGSGGDSLSRSLGNVQALQQLSARSNVNIVLGTGHYRDPHLAGTALDRLSVRAIADALVHDLTVGIAGTQVKAGIIGEVGSERWYISALEERSMRAAAAAHRSTGVAITTHAARWPVGLVQLDLFEECGVDPRRVIVGHCDTVNLPEYHEAIARTGAFVQFDTFRHATGPHFERRVRFITDLADRGFADQILVSHDMCETTHLRSNGGGGLGIIPSVLRQRLTDEGRPDLYEQIVVENPRRALSV